MRDALAQGGYFGFAKIGGERVDLAVYIGFGDIVQINQRELTDSDCGQALHRPRADTAHSHHANVRVLQGVQNRVRRKAVRCRRSGGWYVFPCCVSKKISLIWIILYV